MQQNPPNSNPNKEKKENVRLDLILAKVKSILMDNWGTKLLAILVAIALWAGLITQDPNLTREKLFTDVDVSVTGSDTLKRNGFIVLEDIDEVLKDVNVRVNVPQAQYATVQPANYSVRIELSRIRGAGEQEVRILSTNSATYGSVVQIDPPTVTLTLDEYVTRYRIPVEVTTTGSIVTGYYAAEPSTDPPMIAVSGPKTLVERIVSAQVVADQSTLPAKESTSRRAMPFTLVDESGEVIESDMLQVTSESVLLDSIIVEQAIYSQRTVELSDLGLVTGVPAEGYEIKGVYISPPRVTVAGRATIINDLNLLYADSTVNVTGRTDSVSRSLRIRQPATVEYVSTDVVTVAVEIGPIVTSRAYEAQVELLNLPAGMREVGGTRTATVYLTGAQPWLDHLSAAEMSLTCDLSSVTETGTYALPLNCTIKGSEGQSYTCELNPTSVVVTLIER